MVAPTGEAGEKRAGTLDTVLRVPSETDHGVLNVFRPQIRPV